jgi:type II secretory pathway pseudopilin PulG
MDNKRHNTVSEARGEEGKSLIEIAIVVMIVAVVIAISLPAIANSIRSYNLRSAAVRIAERLGGARTLAMAKNKNVTVAFTTNGLGSVTQYGYDFTPAGAPDGTPDSIDPDDPTQSYYVETPPSGITVTFLAGGAALTNGKGISYTSRGELPIGAGQADIRLSNSSGTMTVSVNLRGQVWVH